MKKVLLSFATLAVAFTFAIGNENTIFPPYSSGTHVAATDPFDPLATPAQLAATDPFDPLAVTQTQA